MGSDSICSWIWTAARTAAGDTRDFACNAQFWTLVLVCAVLTGFAGPFGTAPILPLSLRIVYWIVILVPSALLQSYLSFLGHRLNARQRLHWLSVALLAGIAGIAPLLGLVWSASWLFLSAYLTLDFWVTLIEVAFPTVLMTLLVNAYVQLPYDVPTLRRRPVAALDGPAPARVSAETGQASEDPSPLFEALPPALGREVVCIRADNHYIEVTTAQGIARVLMRLRDAETSLTGLPGMRVHRSWWVNLDHVGSLDRTASGGAELTLTTGGSVPVSRAQREAVRAALDGRG